MFNYFPKEEEILIDLYNLILDKEVGIKERELYKKAILLIEKENEYYFLGKKYEKIDNYDLFLKKNTKKYTEEMIGDIVNNFTYPLPKFSVRYRKMSTRWGVCNNKLKVITLNTLLIKKDLKYLNYVIVHELSHFIYQNHSKEFWKVVEENCKDYKKIRKELKDGNY